MTYGSIDDCGLPPSSRGSFPCVQSDLICSKEHRPTVLSISKWVSLVSHCSKTVWDPVQPRKQALQHEMTPHSKCEEQFASSAESGVGLSVCLSVCPTDTLFYVNSRGGEQGSAPVLIHKIIRRWRQPLWVLSDNVPPSAHLWVILCWILDIKIFYLFLFIWNLWRWTRACMCRHPQRRRSTLDPLKSELQGAVSCPTRVLSTELGSSARTAKPSSPLSRPSVPDCLV